MEQLLTDINACRICELFLPNPPKPIISVNAQSKILIIGQAPSNSTDARNTTHIAYR